ncbi:MAG: HAMP domain-containing protein, partial [Deltaproteobacteria bacterium]
MVTGIRSKTLLAMLLISLLPLAGSFLYLSKISNDRLEAELESRIDTVANFVQRSTSLAQQQIANDLALLARNDNLKSALAAGDPALVQASAGLLADMQKRMQIDLFELLGRDGSILYRNLLGADWPASSGSEHPVIEASLDGEATYEIGLFDGHLGIAAATPVYSAGGIVGHLVGVSYFDEGFARRIASMSNTQIAFFDGSGIYAATLGGMKKINLAAFKPSEAELAALRAGGGRSRIFRHQDIDGTPYAMTQISLGGAKLGAVVALDASSVLQAAGAMKRILWGLVLAATLFALLAGALLSGGIARPLQAVVGSLQEIAEGDADLTRELPVTGKDEVGLLAAGFNRFVFRLRSMVGRIQEVARRLAG